MPDCPDCAKTFDTDQKLGAHRYASHARPVTDIDHGTPSGYQKHRRRAEQPCAECKKAWRDYYEKRKSSSSHSQ